MEFFLLVLKYQLWNCWVFFFHSYFKFSTMEFTFSQNFIRTRILKLSNQDTAINVTVLWLAAALSASRKSVVGSFIPKRPALMHLYQSKVGENSNAWISKHLFYDINNCTFNISSYIFTFKMSSSFFPNLSLAWFYGV